MSLEDKTKKAKKAPFWIKALTIGGLVYGTTALTYLDIVKFHYEQKKAQPILTELQNTNEEVKKLLELQKRFLRYRNWGSFFETPNPPLHLITDSPDDYNGIEQLIKDPQVRQYVKTRDDYYSVVSSDNKAGLLHMFIGAIISIICAAKWGSYRTRGR